MVQKKKTEIKAKVAPVATPTVKKAPKAKKAATIAHGVGRRKKSVARAWLAHGSGKISVNGKPHIEYFDTDVARRAAAMPLAVVAAGANYDVHVLVCGGGKEGQADAVKLGIARAMVELDETMKPDMRKHGLLTVDSRVKERKKYGRKAARRAFQFVKR
jgi:small subunit ribosomal protein S9